MLSMRYTDVIDSIKGPVAGCLACVVCVGLLTVLAYEVEPFERLDATVLSRLSAHDDSIASPAVSFFSLLGDPQPQLAMLALVCLVALRRGLSRLAVASLVLVGGANLTTQALKIVLSHPRYQSILGPRQVGPTAFPSGHATAAFAMACAFALVVPRTWRPAAVSLGALVALAVGFSRVVLHRHDPSDVMCGWLVAGGWCFAVVAGLRVTERLWPDWGTQ